MVMDMKAQQADAINQQNENNKKWAWIYCVVQLLLGEW